MGTLSFVFCTYSWYCSHYSYTICGCMTFIDRLHATTAIWRPLGVTVVLGTCMRVRWVSHTCKYIVNIDEHSCYIFTKHDGAANKPKCVTLGAMSRRNWRWNWVITRKSTGPFTLGAMWRDITGPHNDAPPKMVPASIYRASSAIPPQTTRGSLISPGKLPATNVMPSHHALYKRVCRYLITYPMLWSQLLLSPRA